MNKFETRKKLLVAESEVYRELLKLELQTFKIYSKRTQRRLTSIASYLPFLKSGLPFVTSLFTRKKKGKSAGSSLTRIGAILISGWKAYQRFRPFFGPNKFPVGAEDPTTTAAEEYLSKRL